ncbi:MAG TPA: cardiolipin synthase [Lacunisphaera sp.]|nr:cardiolipin synthase [Lacunisphaera sp.]
MKLPLAPLLRRRRRPARNRTRPKPDGVRRWPYAVAIVVILIGLVCWATSARIVGKPMELQDGPRNPVFVGSLGPLLGAEFTAGNQARLLSNGAEFFPAMLADIAQARHSITLETYIWSSGAISDRFIAALSERARHGVKVRVLVDGMGMLKLKDSDQRRMLDVGIQFLVYGREHWYDLKPNLNHRTHRKLLIIDGRIGYTGGMCIDDRWTGDAAGLDHWRDIQVRVAGPVVREMQAVFASNWLRTTSRLLVGPDYFPAGEPLEHGVIAQCYKSGPDEQPENARVSYLFAIAAARKSILISHAYFVPDDLAIDMLLAARRRGVKVEVIVPAHNDSSFGRAASRSRWGRLLAGGVAFHEYEPAMYHCKMMIVDDVFVTIGSVNFDNRSFSINDEVNVNVLDEGVAQAARRMFEADLRQSRPLTLEEFRRRPVWQKAADQFCGMFRALL